MNDTGNERYFSALGAAVVTLWGDLPQEIQHALFERAVMLGQRNGHAEDLREHLAKFLHDQHERTLLPERADR
jgi:hypothetical protein